MNETTESYQIVYAKDAPERVKNAALTLKAGLEAGADGAAVPVSDDSAAETEFEILFGDTNRAALQPDEELFYYDYVIRREAGKITVRFGSGFAAESAAEMLPELLETGGLEEEYRYHFDTSLFNPLALDPDSFVPVWKDEYTVPDWMTDFGEKLYAITNPSGRLMSVAHRGDVVYYPEDSLEGILSAAFLGADVIEMDLQMTRDHVLVLSHDGVLGTYTNVKEMKGKNGLPDSEAICDWTYAQLQQLSLLDRSRKVSDCKLPSFYEVLLALRGRCFAMVDQKDIGSFTAEDLLEIETRTDALEVSIYSMFLQSASGPAQGDSWSYLSGYAKEHPELERFCAFIEKLDSYMAMDGHQIRKRGWPGGGPSKIPDFESAELYEKAYSERGMNLQYANHIPRMTQYIAENFGPDLDTDEMD